MKHFKTTLSAVALAIATISSQPAFANAIPAQTGEGLSKEPISSAKYVYNSYQADDSLLPVEAYLSNWTHYQQGFKPDLDALSKYDTVILSFFGLCGTEVGDPEITSAIDHLKASCVGVPKYSLMTTDLYGDYQVGFPSAGVAGKYNGAWLDKNPSGMMGVMKKLHDEKGTDVAISVLGWSLSNVASDAVSTKANRTVFINSLIEFATIYPFIKQFDIDWEYPGIAGAEHTKFDAENDAANYAKFVSELRTALDSSSLNDVRIAIASGAPTDKIDAAKLNDLVDAGVDTIHLMTYDFFGEVWAQELAHHTNLMSSDPTKWSSDRAIQYMINDLNMDPKSIQIGYANYSRNAPKSEITSYSPLEGTFDVRGKSTVPGVRAPRSYEVAGTAEEAVTGIHDIFTNYMSASASEGVKPINGYHLYTDKESNADYLYNPDNKLFISLDTPRTVYAKAQYAKKYGLGGIFNWMTDQDEGMMLNAAREGLGYTLQSSKIDMSKIINTCGENVNADTCQKLTHLDDGSTPGNTEVNAGADVQAEFSFENTFPLTGSVSSSDNVASTKWKVKSTTGINQKLVKIASKTSLDTSFSINNPDNIDAPNKIVTIVLELNVTLKDGDVVTDEVEYSLTREQTNGDVVPEITELKYPKKYKMSSGKNFRFMAKASDSEGSKMNYNWNIDSEYAIEFDDSSARKAFINLDSLVNKPSYNFTVNLVVNNDFGNTAEETVKVKVTGDAEANQEPVAAFEVETANPVAGLAVNLKATSTDELVSELTSEWTVTHNGGNITTNNTGSSVSFTPVEAGDYTVRLKVTDVFGKKNSITETVTVTAAPTNDYPAYVEGTTYSAGDIVSNADSSYECKPYPYTGWCGSAAWAYAPGTGTVWTDAWTEVK